MTVAPKITKWPFFLGDLALLVVATWVIYQSPHPVQLWHLLIIIACVAIGAWIGVYPFLEDFRVEARLIESNELTTAAAQIKNLQSVADQIAVATAQWQVVNEHCQKAVSAAKGVEEKITTEMTDFTEFLTKANDSEKSHLRLEVDKLRRGEGEWLQIIVRLLDQIHALHLAATRSGQAGLIDQLSLFQNACREIIRRVGLVPFTAGADGPFDPEVHQLADPQAQLTEDSRVAETLATGYRFQGELIRPAMVTLKVPAPGVSSEIEPPARDLTPGPESIDDPQLSLESIEHSAT